MAGTLIAKEQIRQVIDYHERAGHAYFRIVLPGGGSPFPCKFWGTEYLHESQVDADREWLKRKAACDNWCLSDDTYMLTCGGWKKFDDVELDDMVLSLNPDTRKTELVEIVRKISRCHDGPIVHIVGDYTDSLCTLDHRIPVYRVLNFTEGLTLLPASDLIMKEFSSPGVGGDVGSLACSAVVENYRGRVVCLALERNHIMLCKRNDTVFWTGNCGDTGTRIDPSADNYIPDDFLKELENERAKKAEREDKQAADRASGKHERDARYYEGWRK